MKNNIILILTTLAIIFSANKSFSQDSGPYIRADIGYSNYDNKRTSLISGDDNVHNTKFSIKDSLSYNLGLGYKINKIFRADIIASHRKIKFDTSPVTTTVLIIPNVSEINNYTLMANGYVNILPLIDINSSDFNPYLSIGLGYAHNNMETIGTNFGTAGGGESDNIAMKVGFGIDIKLNQELNLDLAYNYTDLGKIESGKAGTVFTNGIKIPASTDLIMHEVSLGIRYNF